MMNVVDERFKKIDGHFDKMESRFDATRISIKLIGDLTEWNWKLNNNFSKLTTNQRKVGQIVNKIKLFISIFQIISLTLFFIPSLLKLCQFNKF